MPDKKKIIILGSTGSIGENAVKIVAAHAEKFEVLALVARSRVEKLADQSRLLKSHYAMTSAPENAANLAALLPESTKLLRDDKELEQLIAEADLVVAAMVGVNGITPVLAALEAGKTVALANKEVLVSAGELVNLTLKRNPASSIIPIDSEHSAIFQCLAGRKKSEVAKLILTASGGAFRGKSLEEMRKAKFSDALKHPTWSMGAKVTVDSASLMNKALELIEAHYLFEMPPEKLEVLIHPQSVVHSMVELNDGSLLAQLSKPDMRFAIQYALSYPDRWDGEDNLPRLNWRDGYEFTFAPPDERIYPAIGFARQAMSQGKGLPTVLNAANEIAVEAFRRDRIVFTDIWEIIAETMEVAPEFDGAQLNSILEADAWARRKANEITGKK